MPEDAAARPRQPGPPAALQIEAADPAYAGDSRVRRDAQALLQDNAYLWPWDCEEVWEQYRWLEYDGQGYATRAAAISEDLLGESLGRTAAKGWDVYEDDREHSVGTELRAIRGVDPARLLAARFDGYTDWYVFRSEAYRPYATLGEFIEADSLTGTVTFEWFTCHPSAQDWKWYVLRGGEKEALSAALWALFAECADAPAAEEPAVWNPPLISFTVDSEALGAKNKAWSIDRQGYLMTNAEEWGHWFYIGEEAAQKIADWALAHGAEAEPPRTEYHVTGTITEIGEDWFKVDDAILMQEPAVGIEYTIHADDLRVRRWLIRGLLRVGQTVQVTHTGMEDTGPEGGAEIRTAYEVREVQIMDGGEVLIPE